MPNIRLNKILTIEAGKRQGQPCIRGMRISVQDVINWLNAGMSPEEIVQEYPELNKRDISACSQFARDQAKRHQPLTI